MLIQAKAWGEIEPDPLRVPGIWKHLPWHQCETSRGGRVTPIRRKPGPDPDSPDGPSHLCWLDTPADTDRWAWPILGAGTPQLQATPPSGLINAGQACSISRDPRSWPPEVCWSRVTTVPPPQVLTGSERKHLRARAFKVHRMSLGPISRRVRVVGLSKDADPTRAPRFHTAFTAEQVSTLESSFQRQHYLGPLECRRLAWEMRLSEVQIKTWFQNRQMKHKCQVQDSQLSIPFSGALYTPLAFCPPPSALGSCLQLLYPWASLPGPLALGKGGSGPPSAGVGCILKDKKTGHNDKTSQALRGVPCLHVQMVPGGDDRGTSALQSTGPPAVPGVLA
ncbi:Homeobox protein VENTX [Manis javanica]|nr:Homeobox protein VENTX [Manis javanica]